ncbi:MAG TPA: LLM class flavin-dependent oxidoreductase, partial [Acidimicrobiales bacterium]|nr:LLM class flavin-dependent oxidoreductase [Acidimicrobiales bacterium]
MELGLALPQYDYPVAGQGAVEWPTLARWARAAEACGFSSVWLSDHLFVSLANLGGPPERCGGFEPLTALAGLARVTTRVRIGTLVLNAMTRPPGVLAKALATLDQLSGGRLVVGMGAGRHAAELEAAGLPSEPVQARVEKLAEAVTVLRGAMEGSFFSFAGRHYRVEGMRTRPLPVQRPSPPIWIGGGGDRLLAVVARHADGWDGSAWGAGLEHY